VSLELEVSDDGWFVRRGDGPAPSTCDDAPPPERPVVSELAESETIDAALSGIRQVKENEYEVRRSSLNAILENQAWLMRSARIVPEARDGQVDGVRLFGLRMGSVLQVLGFRNGDKILRVGGLPIHGPDKALKAYEKVRKADVIEVDIERGGKPISIVYRMIPD
jgi:general secretion pathway protein C